MIHSGRGSMVWREAVERNRAIREEPEEGIWERMAAWYDQWVSQNDYVEQVMRRLGSRLLPTMRVLEIGPGTGAFTLPLAGAVAEVIAVEPSANMCSALRANLEQAGRTNVHIIEKRIEDALDDLEGSFDVALASHSLYNVVDIAAVMRRLLAVARMILILMGAGDKRPWYQDLHRKLKGTSKPAPANFRQFYPILIEMGILADVEILSASGNYVFDSEDEMIEWWRRHWLLAEGREEEIRHALKGIAERRDGHIGIYDRSRVALLWIERDRNLFMPTDELQGTARAGILGKE